MFILHFNDFITTLYRITWIALNLEFIKKHYIDLPKRFLYHYNIRNVLLSHAYATIQSIHHIFVHQNRFYKRIFSLMHTFHKKINIGNLGTRISGKHQCKCQILWDNLYIYIIRCFLISITCMEPADKCILKITEDKNPKAVNE